MKVTSQSEEKTIPKSERAGGGGIGADGSRVCGGETVIEAGRGRDVCYEPLTGWRNSQVYVPHCHQEERINKSTQAELDADTKDSRREMGLVKELEMAKHHRAESRSARRPQGRVAGVIMATAVTPAGMRIVGTMSSLRKLCR